MFPLTLGGCQNCQGGGLGHWPLRVGRFHVEAAADQRGPISFEGHFSADPEDFAMGQHGPDRAARKGFAPLPGDEGCTIDSTYPDLVVTGDSGVEVADRPRFSLLLSSEAPTRNPQRPQVVIELVVRVQSGRASPCDFLRTLVDDAGGDHTLLVVIEGPWSENGTAYFMGSSP